MQHIVFSPYCPLYDLKKKQLLCIDHLKHLENEDTNMDTICFILGL